MSALEPVQKRILVIRIRKANAHVLIPTISPGGHTSLSASVDLPAFVFLSSHSSEQQLRFYAFLPPLTFCYKPGYTRVGSCFLSSGLFLLCWPFK